MTSQLIYKKSGALPSQMIAQLCESGFIKNVAKQNIKPASLDLTISDEIYQVKSIIQPRPQEKIRSLLPSIIQHKHDIHTPLQVDATYLVLLREQLSLPQNIYGYANPKSTTGRNDLHVRLVSDDVSRFDVITAGGWSGEMWLAITSRSFPLKLQTGASLNQLRFFTHDTRFNELETEIAIQQYALLWTQQGIQVPYKDIRTKDNDGSIILTLDLQNKNIGWECQQTDAVLDISQIGTHDPAKFFTPLKMNGDFLHLKKDHFYIISTLESVRIPPNLACEMVPVDERAGEFRSHYAGFIDPGWGWGADGKGQGRPLTLEVRPFEDLLVRNRQPIAKIYFEKMIEVPHLAYDSLASNYLQQTGPALSKHFIPQTKIPTKI